MPEMKRPLVGAFVGCEHSLLIAASPAFGQFATQAAARGPGANAITSILAFASSRIP
jgi:hypothetical protein